MGNTGASAFERLTTAHDEIIRGFMTRPREDGYARGVAPRSVERETSRGVPAHDGTIRRTIAGANPRVSARQDGGEGAGGPTVASVSFASTPAAGQNGTYKLGDTIRVEVAFSEAVSVTGTPTLELAIGAGAGAARMARYVPGGSDDTLTFAYTVAAGDEDVDGAAVVENGLALGGGTIVANDGARDAVVAHDGVDGRPGHKVDGVRPRIVNVQLPSNQPDDILSAGERLSVTILASESVVLAGAPPTIRLEVGPQTRTVAFEMYIDQANALTFGYAVVAGDFDPDGVRVPANSLALAGGTIRDAAGNDLVLDHPAASDVDDVVHGSTGTPMLSIADATGPENGNALAFTVSLAAPSGYPTSVSYATADGTGAGAATAGADYTAQSGRLTIEKGEREATISVPVLDDTDPEGDESFAVTLSSPENAVTARGRATGTIEEDDIRDVTVSFARAAYDVSEGGTVTVTLDAARGGALTIPLRAEGRGGAEGGDWSVPTSVSFGPAETSKAIAFAATDDVADDDGETVVLRFGPALPEGVLAGSPATATVSILDNDNQTVSIRARDERVDEGRPAVFELTRDGGGGRGRARRQSEREVPPQDLRVPHDRAAIAPRGSRHDVPGGDLRRGDAHRRVLARQHRRRTERGERGRSRWPSRPATTTGSPAPRGRPA